MPSSKQGASASGDAAHLELNSVDLYAWMRATLEAIANGHQQARIDELMPWAFKSSPPAPTA